MLVRSSRCNQCRAVDEAVERVSDCRRCRHRQQLLARVGLAIAVRVGSKHVRRAAITTPSPAKPRRAGARTLGEHVLVHRRPRRRLRGPQRDPAAWSRPSLRYPACTRSSPDPLRPSGRRRCDGVIDHGSCATTSRGTPREVERRDLLLGVREGRAESPAAMTAHGRRRRGSSEANPAASNNKGQTIRRWKKFYTLFRVLARSGTPPAGSRH